MKLARRTKEDWMNRDNNPDSPEERMIFITSQLNGMCSCTCLFPGSYYDILNGNDFEPLRDHPEFTKLCDRVKALIVTKQKES